MDKWFILWLNPEPWAIGSVWGGKGRAHVSPNPNLVAFQAAVKEALADEEKLHNSYRKFEFYFWRQQAKYIDAADRVRQRNQADATNMQKGLEDALQGVLIENDRDVVDIRSIIVEQGPNVEPLILIRACSLAPVSTHVVPLMAVPAEILERGLDGPPKSTGDEQDQWQNNDIPF